MKNEKKIEAMTVIDENYYPKEEFLNYIKLFRPCERSDIDNFIELLKKAWYYPENGVILRNNKRLELHTHGWGGNELIVREILSNIYLTHFNMEYIMWKAGGHYYFDLK